MCPYSKIKSNFPLYFFGGFVVHVVPFNIASYALLIVAYIVFRSIGKFAGAFWGAKLAKSESKIRKYLGYTLLSQAGVAIGLSLGAAGILNNLGLKAEATQVISVMTASTFLIMLLGPVLVKYGLNKAGELRVKD